MKLRRTFFEGQLLATTEEEAAKEAANWLWADLGSGEYSVWNEAARKHPDGTFTVEAETDAQLTKRQIERDLDGWTKVED